MIDKAARARLFEIQKIRLLGQDLKQTFTKYLDEQKEANASENTEQLLKHIVDRLDMNTMLLAYIFNALKLSGEIQEDIEKNTR